MAAFKDHFSRQSAAYSRYRPGYPPELIEFVASCAPDTGLAVDSATGNGQAAVALAAHFDVVLAVDASRSQLERAARHPRVQYVCSTVERLPVAAGSVALVAAAQAAHWFDFDRFYSETVGRYWPPERRYVEEGYRTLPFPWREQPAPQFSLETSWDLDQVMGYLATWSSVQRYKDAHGQRDPLPELRAHLAPLWPADHGARLVAWPIHLRVGRT
jgi:SAM-dependent methyltransferase